MAVTEATRTHPTNTPAKKAERTTSYHILKRLSAKPADPNTIGGADTFELVGRNIQAANRDAAIRAHAEKAGDKAPGKYVAVTSRSFTEIEVKTETITTVKLG